MLVKKITKKKSTQKQVQSPYPGAAFEHGLLSSSQGIRRATVRTATSVVAGEHDDGVF